MHNLSTNDAGPAYGPRREMNIMPLVGEAILAAILAHWREHDVVARSYRPRGEGSEEMRVAATFEDTATVLARAARVGGILLRAKRRTGIQNIFSPCKA